MPEPKISTEQARRTGDIIGIATVERLDRIADFLAALLNEVRADVPGSSGVAVSDHPSTTEEKP